MTRKQTQLRVLQTVYHVQSIRPYVILHALQWDALVLVVSFRKKNLLTVQEKWLSRQSREMTSKW